MNPPAENNEKRKELIYNNVKTNFLLQETIMGQMNYLKSCAKHGGEIEEIVNKIKKEYNLIS